MGDWVADVGAVAVVEAVALDATEPVVVEFAVVPSPCVGDVDCEPGVPWHAAELAAARTVIAMMPAVLARKLTGGEGFTTALYVLQDRCARDRTIALRDTGGTAFAGIRVTARDGGLVATIAAARVRGDRPMEEVAFGRYRLRELLGAGGMGKVYKAYDTLIGRDVAVKVLPTELSAEAGYRERFRREAQTSARLAEPHIIPIHDTGEIDGQLYLVMPVVDGIDLQALLKRDGPMAPDRAVNVIEQLAAALDAAHAAGLVHRDVKPSNALLTGRDFVYLIDFGIAHDSGAPKLTSTGMVLGSWAYMAPERFTARGAGPSADVYSLACVLCECLTGRQPYPGNSLEQQFAGHYSEDPPRPSSVNPTVPTGFDEVIARGMAKDPDQRYPSGYELAVAARRALTTPPAAPGPDPRPAPLRPGPTPAPVPVLDPTRASPEYTSNATQGPVGPTLFDTAQPPPQPTAARSTRFAVGPTRRDPSQAPPAPTIAKRGVRPAAVNPTPAPVTAPPQRRPARRWPVLVVTAVVLIVAGVALGGYLLRPTSETSAPTTQSGPGSPAAAQPGQPASPTAQPSADGAQTELPFTGLGGPGGIAVNGGGDVFVTDKAGNRLLRLGADSGSPTTMTFAGLNGPGAVAVDGRGDIVVANTAGGVLKLAAGSAAATELPFADVPDPRGVAVSGVGDVYVSGGADKVLKLAAGSTNTTAPAFTGLSAPGGVAVDGSGNVFVADTGNNRIVRLAVGESAAVVLPFEGLSAPGGVSVDGSGNVYVADTGNNRIVRLAVGESAAVVLPFEGLSAPGGVAVDGSGNVYVADTGNNRILKLAAG